MGAANWTRRVVLAMVAIAIVAGIGLRFSYLERKVYWLDETFTSLWVAGHGFRDLGELAAADSNLTIPELQRYQQPAPETRATDTLAVLAREFPEHPPLYYVLSHWWVQGLGYSVAAMRLLPALAGALLLPAVYWWCWELFRSPLTGGIAAGLVAVSPLHVLYAQEARQYSLWTVAIALTSAAFVRAVRLPQWRNWWVYAGLLLLGFYTGQTHTRNLATIFAISRVQSGLIANEVPSLATPDC